jgi:hypothetical protein
MATVEAQRLVVELSEALDKGAGHVGCTATRPSLSHGPRRIAFTILKLGHLLPHRERSLSKFQAHRLPLSEVPKWQIP